MRQKRVTNGDTLTVTLTFSPAQIDWGTVEGGVFLLRGAMGTTAAVVDFATGEARIMSRGEAYYELLLGNGGDVE